MAYIPSSILWIEPDFGSSMHLIFPLKLSLIKPRINLFFFFFFQMHFNLFLEKIACDHNPEIIYNVSCSAKVFNRTHRILSAEAFAIPMLHAIKVSGAHTSVVIHEKINGKFSDETLCFSHGNKWISNISGSKKRID